MNIAPKSPARNSIIHTKQVIFFIFKKFTQFLSLKKIYISTINLIILNGAIFSFIFTINKYPEKYVYISGVLCSKSGSRLTPTFLRFRFFTQYIFYHQPRQHHSINMIIIIIITKLIRSGRPAIPYLLFSTHHTHL